MRTTDTWGVDSGYEDASEQWHETTPETRQAIHAAMQVNEGDVLPDGQDAVRIVQAGRRIPWGRGTLRLEDGTPLRVEGSLPADLPLGYHDFVAQDCEEPTRVIVAPPHCPLPKAAWGWSAQLYALRSADSWGIGDLADLRRLGQWSKELGAGFTLVNPLVAATPVLPYQPSPYYPSSRQFRDPLYLRVEEVPGAARLGADLQRLATSGRALNRSRHLDRDAVYRLKDEALRAIWRQFPGDPDFDRFCVQRGASLEQYAAFCAMSQRLGGGWRAWPTEYHRPDAPAVREFIRENRREIDYHRWLQWLLERQLSAAAEEIALVQDLPIGVDPGGADAWIWQDCLAAGCSVGAPPDIFNPAGQNWGLPPLVPHKLRAARYEPYIETLRASIRQGGGLRIDHVMGLFRLYWIPEGFGPDQGAYVRYPADEMLAIVALEAHRAGAFVVGEDLGTVEKLVRKKLADHRILSFRLVWFEKGPPATYPELAMAAVTTHDLATTAGLWTGYDLEEQLHLGLDAEKPMRELTERHAALAGLNRDMPVEEVVDRTYRLLGQSPSLLLVATTDDALAVPERPNVPGMTVDQRPNWSLATPGGLEALEQSPLARKIAQSLRREERQGNGSVHREPEKTGKGNPM
jgi:4-alpha-glucanotransferase